MKEIEKDMFICLDNLRESGLINMNGAAPYLKETFNIDIYYARSILKEWINSKS